MQISEQMFDRGVLHREAVCSLSSLSFSLLRAFGCHLLAIIAVTNQIHTKPLAEFKGKKSSQSELSESRYFHRTKTHTCYFPASEKLFYASAIFKANAQDTSYFLFFWALFIP